MPLYRRLPKRGFTNNFGRTYEIISLRQLDKFDAGSEVDNTMLVECGMVSKGSLVKILANGEITKAMTVKVDKVSAQAKTLIEAAGGKVLPTVAEVA